MKKIIFGKLIKDVVKFFLLTSLSLSIIIWVVQAVNFLDYISEDGHGIYTYLVITTLNFPKIFTKIMPFCIFITIFYVINRYELKNELIIFWNIGIKKIKFINVLVSFSIIFLIAQLILNTIIVPKSLNAAREYIRTSNIDFFPSLIKEKKFIDAVEHLTIFVGSKDDNGDLKNIYLKDKINATQSQIIYAKKGSINYENNKNYLILLDGSFIDIDKKKITSFAFKKTEFDLSKYKTKTTTFPKYQEIGTKYLLSCLYKLAYDKNYIIPANYIYCSDDTFGDVIEEIFKRTIKPFFIPVIVLISSLIVLFNKDYFNYSKIQYVLFFLCFSVIVTSEISSRYIYDMTTTLFFATLPLLIFLIGYFYLFLKLRIKT